jgi:hypothetical protein
MIVVECSGVHKGVTEILFDEEETVISDEMLVCHLTALRLKVYSALASYTT